VFSASPKKYPARIVLTVLAALWLSLAPSGCRRAATPASTAELVTTFNALRDDPQRHLEIVWLGSPYAEGGQPGSWLQRRLEEQFNLSLEVSFMPVFSYDKLLKLRLTGGQIPEVFWLRNAGEVRRAAAHGFITEVPYETLAHHAPAYLRLLERHAPDAWLLSLVDGRNFGIPTFTTTVARLPQTGVWNRTWLERVGIKKTPGTLVEMEEALRRFRTGDPDRDGQQDTFGMCPWRPGSSSGSGTLDRSFEEIFGAFGVMQNGWMLHEGRVVWGATLPGARLALETLRRWYADGLIHPDYMTLPIGNLEVRSQLFKGKVGYIMGFNLGNYGVFEKKYPTSLQSLHQAIHPGEELAPGWFPIGPDGHRGVRTWDGSIGGVIVFGPQLVRAPEKLVRVLAMFDALARDPELFIELRVGRRGLHWDWNEDYGIRKRAPYDTRAVASAELMGEGITNQIDNNYGYFAPFSAPQEVVDRHTIPAARQFQETYMRPEWGLSDVLLMADTVPSAYKYLHRLVDLQATTFTEIIIGKRPIEAFDDFVVRWRAEGGDMLTREANELYLQKQAIRARVAAFLVAEKSPAPPAP